MQLYWCCPLDTVSGEGLQRIIMTSIVVSDHGTYVRESEIMMVHNYVQVGLDS